MQRLFYFYIVTLKSYVSGFPFVKSDNFIKINDRIDFIKAIKSLGKKKKSLLLHKWLQRVKAISKVLDLVAHQD